MVNIASRLDVYLAGHGEGGAVEGSKAHDVGRVYVGIIIGSGCMYGVLGGNRQVEVQSGKQLAVAQGVAQRADYSAGSRGSETAGRHIEAAALARQSRDRDRRTDRHDEIDTDASSGQMARQAVGVGVRRVGVAVPY